MEKYILSIDQGTTSSRAMIFDLQGKVIALHQLEHQQYYPHPAWVEHDPEEIWQNIKICCQQAVTQANISLKQLLALGISNQRETIVIWDRQSGKPIYPAIVWQDRRTADFCEMLKQQGYEIDFQQRTGLLIDPYFSATKIHWLLENIPTARSRAANGQLALGTMDSFLLWKLTQGEIHATDLTNAARTGLFNIHTLCWDQDLLELFNIPQTLLPEVKPNCFNYGEAKDLFEVAIPIGAMAGDQQAAAIGQCCFAAGEVKSTYGTGCFLLMNIGKRTVISKHRLLTTILYQLNNEMNYALEGSIFVAGAGIKWLRDKLQLIKHVDEVADLCASLPNNEGVYFVPAFAGLGAPYWNPSARGTLVGLTLQSGRSHVVRALMEAVAYQTKDLIIAMESDANIHPETLRVDGGMVTNSWLLQFLADILQKTIQRSPLQEATALGIFYLVGLQQKIFPSLESLHRLFQIENNFFPQMQKVQADNYYAGWQQAVWQCQRKKN